MSEINENQNNIHGHSRRDFLVNSGKKVAGTSALVASYYLGIGGEGALTTTVDELNTKSNEELLSQKLDIQVNLIYGDHLPPVVESEKHPSYSGELSLNALMYDSSLDISSLPYESSWYNGVEILGKKRMEFLINQVEAANVLIALDSTPYYTHEYLDKLKEASDRRSLVALIASIPAGSATIIASEFLVDKVGGKSNLPRREFLKRVAQFTAGGLASSRALRTVGQFEPDVDLSVLPEVWQSLYKILPNNEAIHLRNISMVNSLNTLASIDLTPHTDSLTVFAGKGHIGMNALFSQDESSVHQLLVSSIESKLRLYEQTWDKLTDPMDRWSILSAGYAFGELFPPIFIRLNNHKDTNIEFRKDIGQYVNSSGLAYVQILNKLDQEYYSVKGYHNAFFASLASNYAAYVNNMQSFTQINNKSYHVGMPGDVNFLSSQESMDLVLPSRRLYINNGHISGIVTAP